MIEFVQLSCCTNPASQFYIIMHRQPGHDCISSEVNHWLEHISQILKLMRRAREEYKTTFKKKKMWAMKGVTMTPNG